MAPNRRPRRWKPLVVVVIFGAVVVAYRQGRGLFQAQQQHQDPKPQQYVRRNKKGRVVMRTIETVVFDQLRDISDDELLRRANNTFLNTNDKEPILKRLRAVGIARMDDRTIAALPTWRDVQSLYYAQSEKAVVHARGCGFYQYIGAAGLFNTGTNALTYYMRSNLQIVSNINTTTNAVLTQVPWDKHWLSSLRWNHSIPLYRNFSAAVTANAVLPIVTIRDPWSWMQTMCAQPYLVQYVDDERGKHKNTACPNLHRAVHMPKMISGRTWPSLLHLWNDWYREYFYSELPFLMVRFEDLIWQPQEVVRAIQHCSGATAAAPNFVYVVDQSKWEHVRQYGPQSNRITAMMKHGNPRRRIRNWSARDVEMSKAIVDDELLGLFGYVAPTTLLT
jgi:hypothetical protein